VVVDLAGAPSISSFTDLEILFLLPWWEKKGGGRAVDFIAVPGGSPAAPCSVALWIQWSEGGHACFFFVPALAGVRHRPEVKKSMGLSWLICVISQSDPASSDGSCGSQSSRCDGAPLDLDLEAGDLIMFRL
jgi:hypothetical protein